MRLDLSVTFPAAALCPAGALCRAVVLCLAAVLCQAAAKEGGSFPVEDMSLVGGSYRAVATSQAEGLFLGAVLFPGVALYRAAVLSPAVASRLTSTPLWRWETLPIRSKRASCRAGRFLSVWTGTPPTYTTQGAFRAIRFIAWT